MSCQPRLPQKELCSRGGSAHQHHIRAGISSEGLLGEIRQKWLTPLDHAGSLSPQNGYKRPGAQPRTPPGQLAAQWPWLEPATWEGASLLPKTLAPGASSGARPCSQPSYKRTALSIFSSPLKSCSK